MNWLNFNYIIQAHILFIVLLGIYHFLLKKETSFNFNRKYLMLIGFISLLIPLINIPVIGGTIINLPYVDPSQLGNETAVEANSNELSIWSILNVYLVPAYLSVIGLLMLTFLFRIIKIRRKVSRIKQAAQFNYLNSIYVSEQEIEPFTFFKDSYISHSMLNRDGSELIINHERTHAKENHSIDIIIAELFNCFLFLNPFKKIYIKHISENHEYLADATVTQKKLNERYTSLLINLTLKREGLQIVSFFAKPSILNRIDMMKRTKKSRINQVVASVFTILLVSMFSCDFQEEEIVIQEVQNTNLKELSSEDFKNKVFQIVEIQAEPKNGIQDYYDNIGDFLEGKYPQQAKRMGVEGVVFIQFVIEKDGSLSNITPAKGIGAGCDELAVKAVESVGNWRAGMQNGEVVRSQRVIPIRFKLDNEFL